MKENAMPACTADAGRTCHPTAVDRRQPHRSGPHRRVTSNATLSGLASKRVEGCRERCGQPRDAIVGESARHAQTDFGDRLKIGLCYYLAGLMGNDHPRANSPRLSRARHCRRRRARSRDRRHRRRAGQPSGLCVPYEGPRAPLGRRRSARSAGNSVELLKREEYVATNLVKP